MNNKYREVRKRMTRPTTGNELLKCLDGKAELWTNKELQDARSIDELLGPHGSAIILYEMSSMDNGHWCCCFRYENRIEFFDSYGTYVDEPVDWTNPKLRKAEMLNKHLALLLADADDAGAEVCWNETPFQSSDEMIQTCGLWTLQRLVNKHLTEAEFSHLLFELPEKNGLLPDEVVSLTCLNMWPTILSVGKEPFGGYLPHSVQREEEQDEVDDPLEREPQVTEEARLEAVRKSLEESKLSSVKESLKIIRDNAKKCSSPRVEELKE